MIQTAGDRNISCFWCHSLCYLVFLVNTCCPPQSCERKDRCVLKHIDVSRQAERFYLSLLNHIISCYFNDIIHTLMSWRVRTYKGWRCSAPTPRERLSKDATSRIRLDWRPTWKVIRHDSDTETERSRSRVTVAKTTKKTFWLRRTKTALIKWK